VIRQNVPFRGVSIFLMLFIKKKVEFAPYDTGYVYYRGDSGYRGVTVLAMEAMIVQYL